jgi:hypothetical protein
MGVGRVLEYKNLSTSLSYNGTIELNDALSCTKYGFNYCEWQVGTTITQVPLNSPVDVLNFQINLSTIPGNVSIGPNASLFIRECIIKDDPLENYCPSDENSGCKISTQFSYECSGTCDQTTRVTSMERGDKRPFISIERVNPANNTSCNPDCVWWDPSTASTLTDWEFVIRNSGDDLARDIELGLSNPFPNSLFILPSFNIASCTTTFSNHPTFNRNFRVDQITNLVDQLPHPLPSCSAASSAIGSILFRFDWLLPGDEVRIPVDIEYCCPDGNNRDAYFENPAITMNHWEFAPRRYQQECSLSSINNFDQSMELVDNKYFTISGKNSSGQDIWLQQEFYPSTADMDMTGPCTSGQIGDCCSDPMLHRFEINNIDFNRDLSGTYNLRGTETFVSPYDQSNLSTPICTGGVVVNIRLDQGLLLEGTAAATGNGTSLSEIFVDGAFFRANNNNWQFSTNLSTMSGGCGSVTEYNLYFDFQDIPGIGNSASEIFDYLNNADFEFQMKGCCDCLGNSTSANPVYLIEFYIRGIDGNCDIPIRRQENAIQLHCPGCVLPGPIVEGGSDVLRRESYGMVDADNDGKADSPLQWITAPNPNEQAIHKSIQGDRLSTNLIFRISPANPPYPSLDILRLTTPLDRMYLELSMPESNTASFDVEVTELTLTITQSVNSCAPCSFTVQANDPRWSNIYRDCRSGTVVSTEDLHVFDLSEDVLHSFGIDPSYHFNDNDRFELSIQYCVRGNGPNRNTFDTDDNRFESFVQAAVYLTGTDLWALGHYDAYFNDGSSPGQAYSVAMDQIAMNPSAQLQPDWLYVCETRAGFHYFFSNRSFVSAILYDYNGVNVNEKCQKSIKFDVISRIGGSLWNVFPFEYRSPSRPNNVTFNLGNVGTNISLNSSVANSYSVLNTFNENGCNPASRHVAGNTSTINLNLAGANPFFNLAFGTDVTIADENLVYNTSDCDDPFSNNSLIAGDERLEFHFEVPFETDECDVETTYTAPNDIVSVTFEQDQQCQPPAITTSVSNIPSNEINPSAPRITVSPPGTIIVSTPSTSIAQFTISNNHYRADVGFTVENPFLFIPADPQITIGSVTASGGGSIPATAIDWDDDGVLPNIAGQLFRLPNIADGGNIQVSVEFDADCFDPSTPLEAIKTLNWITGWNCDAAYLSGTIIEEEELCEVAPFSFDVRQERSEVVFDLQPDSPMPQTICSYQTCTLRAEVKYSAVTNLVFSIGGANQDMLTVHDFDFNAMTATGTITSPAGPITVIATPNLVNCATGPCSSALPFTAFEIEIINFDGNGPTLPAGATVTITLPVRKLCYDSGNIGLLFSTSFERYCGTINNLSSKGWSINPLTSNCLDDAGLTVCAGVTQVLIDLDPITSGTITGPGVVGTSWPFFFNSTLPGAGSQPLHYEISLTTAPACIRSFEIPVIIESCGPNVNSVLACSGQTSVLEVNNINLQGPFTYSWSTNGTTLGTSASLTVAPTVTTVYTVVVTGNGGTTASATATVDVISGLGADCCIPSDFIPGTDHALTNTTISAYAASAGWGSSVSTADKILINGTLTVDVDFTFDNCENIVMGPNARIVVTPGIQLQILSSHIYSCGAMWESIDNQPGALLRVADSHIEDGKRAIRSWGTPMLLEVHSNHFDANRTSIELSEGDFINAVFYGNLFQCTRYIKPASNLEWASHHFSLNDAVNVTIGMPVLGANQIEDARYGIFANRSSFSVQNNSFTRQYNPEVKYGIYANGTFVVGPPATTHSIHVGDQASNSFGAITKGIYIVRNYDVDIFQNVFDGTALGIEVYNNMNRSISIRDNSLAGFANYGIQLQDNHYATIEVSGNTMNAGANWLINPESKKGIYVNNSTFSKAALVIENNSVTNCYTGIHLMNHKYANIKGNSINFSVPDNIIDQAIDYRQGIWLQWSDDVDVRNNQILRACTQCGTVFQNGNGEYMRGIISDITQHALIHDNTLQTIPRGILTRMKALGNQYYCNYLEDYMTGMFFSDNAKIDPQGSSTNSTDNQWHTQNISLMRIGGELDPPGTNVDWYFNYVPGDVHDPNPYSTNVVLEINGASSQNCILVPPIPLEPEKLSELLNDSSYLAYLTEKKLYDRLIVYRQLKDSLQLMYSGSAYDLTLQNFFNLMALGNTGYLENVKDALNSGDKAAAEIANQQVVPSNLHESNNKYVNTILIASDKDSIDYDANERINLLSIAYQNPIVGGEAVYRARAILRLDLNDETIGFRMAQAQSSISRTFQVYPNPTKEELIVSGSPDRNQEASLTVWSLLGTPILQKTLRTDETSITLDLRHCQPGIYRLVISTGNEEQSHSIVLLR